MINFQEVIFMFGLTPFERKGYDLFSAFNEFEKDLFDRNFFRNNMTIKNEFRTDIQDNGDKYVLEAELPGFNKEDINIDISKDYLTISAKRDSVKEEKDENGGYICRERSVGSFQRSFGIAGVDSDAIEASYSDGILKLELPKKEEKPLTKKLEIK